MREIQCMYLVEEWTPPCHTMLSIIRDPKWSKLCKVHSNYMYVEIYIKKKKTVYNVKGNTCLLWGRIWWLGWSVFKSSSEKRNMVLLTATVSFWSPACGCRASFKMSSSQVHVFGGLCPLTGSAIDTEPRAASRPPPAPPSSYVLSPTRNFGEEAQSYLEFWCSHLVNNVQIYFPDWVE